MAREGINLKTHLLTTTMVLMIMPASLDSQMVHNTLVMTPSVFWTSKYLKRR